MVLAICESFQNDDTEAFLLVDATNAFNALNRPVAYVTLINYVPHQLQISINMYRSAADLYVGDSVLSLQEGTTQGDTLSMPLCALATVPLIRRLQTLSFSHGMLIMHHPQDELMT